MATDIESAVESLDHPVDNAPVRSLHHRGLTVEGYSRAAVQTYWRIPELKLGFDLGAALVVHDHTQLVREPLASGPYCRPADPGCARRMLKMEPPTVYLPAEAIEGVQLLLRAVQRLDRGRMPVELVGLNPGDEVELSRELVVKAFPTRHTIPSLGYLVWERRKKLKPEYHDLTGEQIRDLRLSGVEVSAEIRLPRVAYLGDTSPQGLDVFPEIYQAQFLILEMTFVAPNERPALIHKFGHTHLDDLLERTDRFENEVIIASHFSTRLHPDQIQRIIERRLPESLRSRLKIWL